MIAYYGYQFIHVDIQAPSTLLKGSANTEARDQKPWLRRLTLDSTPQLPLAHTCSGKQWRYGTTLNLSDHKNMQKIFAKDNDKGIIITCLPNMSYIILGHVKLVN